MQFSTCTYGDASNSALSVMVRQTVMREWPGDAMVVMVGEYAGGPRLYSTVTTDQPAEEGICRTPAERMQMETDGKDFVWCTLESLRGTLAHDPAAKAVLALDMFVRPVGESLERHGLSFRSGRAQAASVITRFIDDTESLPTWKALESSRTASDKIVQLLTESVGDSLLDGLLDAIRPLPVDAFPSNL